METSKAPNVLFLFKQYLLNKSFLWGSIVPLALYFLLCKITNGLWPAFICMVYSLIYVAIQLIKTKRIDFFGAVSLVVLLITLPAIIFSKDERFFLFKNTLDELVLFIAFGVTLFTKRPKIQIIVEEVNEFDPRLEGSEEYKQTWRRETIVWIIYYLVWFSVQVILYYILPKQIFLTIQVVFGKLSFIGLLGFSFWYATKMFVEIQHKYEESA